MAPAYRYHPAIVAQAMATLGCLYPERVFLGVGTGEALNEVPLGVEWPEQKVRFRMLKEACLLIQRLWTEERVTFEGEYFQTDRATIYDRPERADPAPHRRVRPGGGAARRAHRRRLHHHQRQGHRRSTPRSCCPRVREGIEKAGRSPDEVELMLEMKVSFDPDLAARWRTPSYWGALALSPEEKIGVEDPIEMQRLADALPVERTATRWIVSRRSRAARDRVRASTSRWASATWSSTSPGPTRSEPSADTASTWCRGCEHCAMTIPSQSPLL